METVHRNELVARASVRSGIAHDLVNESLGALLEEVQRSVADGERVTLTGFGTFEPRLRQATTARNPKTGEPVPVPERKAPGFKAGATFKQRVADA